MSELIFRPLVGYETSHIISNKGEIISLNYNRTGKPKVIKQNKDKLGYMIVSLYDWNSKRVRTHKVHRLVALTFLPNPNNLKCVNHKDEDKTNNSVDNLEWCTHSYNATYGTRIERIVKTRLNRHAKPVRCVETGIIYPSVSFIQRTFGYNQANIASVCKGKLKTAYGYHWEYINQK